LGRFQPVARATVFPTYNLSCLPELPGSAKSGLWQYRQIDSPFLSNLPMLLKDSSQVEKEFRSFLRARPLKLSSLTLPIAFDAMAEFWTTTRFSNVLTEGGDGIACYQDVTDHGRGTRLEIGFIRLLRLQSDCSLPPSPVHRLRLRICYKWDMDVIKHLLPAGTWSFACWDTRELDAFKQAIFDTVGFSRMREKKPAEVNTSFDTVTSVLHLPKPEPGAGQMWWGVM
jgi:hypothetical protein